MTTENMLYLAMVIGAFVLFSAGLAYQSWPQSRLGSDMLPERAEHKGLPDRLAA